MKDRKDIKEEYTWNLKNIYLTLNDFNNDIKLTNDMLDELKTYENIVTTSANNLYDVMELATKIERKIDKIYCYASLSFDLDTSCNSKQELCEKAENLYNSYSKISYFITPSILKIEDMSLFYKDNPGLLDYKRNIEDVRRYKEHILNDSEEKLLSSIGKIIGNSYNTYELLKDCDMSFDRIKNENGELIELNDNNYSLYIESSDRKVRETAFKTLYKEYEKFSNTFASLLATNMKELSTISKITKYTSSIERSLFSDSVTVNIYNNLIDSVHSKIDYIYDYYEIKKKMLGLNELHLYDVYVPCLNNYNRKFDYEEAKNIILDVLKIFGEEYINVVKEGLQNRWIDVYPTKNKRSGGYSGGSYDTNPYILLNYQDKYNDMSTLIHEMGHSMHSYYSRKYNNYQESNYKIFVAEVASTVNELLLSRYMLNKSDSNDEKKFILNNLLELYRATIYRQTMFAEFEKKLAELSDNDESLTKDKISEVYYDLNKFYFGPNVVVDKEIMYEWERVPHFYYDFYVYKYATGLSAATVIVNNILSGKENAVSDYIDFLKCGSKENPIDSLKIAGVDLTDKSVIDSALDEFKKYIDMYKKCI